MFWDSYNLLFKRERSRKRGGWGGLWYAFVKHAAIVRWDLLLDIFNLFDFTKFPGTSRLLTAMSLGKFLGSYRQPTAGIFQNVSG